MPTITSQKPNRAAQLTLRPFTLLCTLVLLTFGVAHAQEISPEGEDLGRVSKRPAKGEGQQGAVARILAGVDEGKISKERAAEMVKALNKNINQEDHANLKKMLEEYWKADPSIRGLLSTRIEGYLQHLQMGRSPAREAASQGRTNEGADIWTAAATGNLDAIKGFLEAGTDINAKAPSTHWTPLMVVALRGQTEAAKLLLAKGAKADIRDNDGSTALHMASFLGHIEIVKALLKKGAEINISNVRSDTPYDAVKGAWDEELEGLYQSIGRGLNLELDIKKIKAARPQIAALLAKEGGKSGKNGVNSPVKADTAQRAQKGAVARILAGVDEGKISKEKAAEMVAALNKNSDQEDPDLKNMLDDYWKADPSIRGLLSTRIEGYLQWKADNQGRNSERTDQGRGDAAESQQRAAQDGAEEKEGPLLSELPEEDALEVLYQRMLRDHPGIKDISKERLMPRLRAMLEEELARERSGTRVGTLKWSVPLGGGVGYHSPAIAEDGTVYMAGDRQRLVAMNPDGTVKWTFVARSGYPIAGAAIGKDGTIYIGTWSQDGSDSRIYAITADGTEKWSYPVGDKIEFSSPAIGKDGTIYIGCYDDHLYAMNPDGTLRWRFRADFNLMSSPAVGQDGTIYIASENGKLYAVNPEDGSKKWDFQTGNYIHGSPSIAKDGTVYIGSSDKHLYAIAPKDGSEKWRFAAKDQVHAPPAIGEDGTLYVGSNDGNFYALNPDGTEKWRFKTGKRVDNGSAAIGRDGTIYFGSDDNHIYALNPDGSEKWRFAMGGVDDMDSSPAIGVDGTIYVGSMDGNLYAIHGESGGLADTPWPMFGGDLRHTGRAHSTFHSAGGAQKGAVARILAGVDEGKLSKEKATEMVKALNKNIDQEDPTLKFLLNQYWKADPSVRGALSTRIEGYLQHKAARQNRENKDADQVQNRDDEPTSEQAKAAAQYNVEPANKGLLKIVTDVAKGKTSIEKAADAIATMYKEFGVKKDDSTVKKQLEMATEFNESERMHKWFTLCIEVYIKKTFIEPANQESEAQEKEK